MELRHDYPASRVVDRSDGPEPNPANDTRVTPSIGRSGRNSWLIALAAALVIVALLQPTFASMVSLWAGIQNFNHCFLIAPASAWLIWDRRSVLATVEPSISIGAFVLGLLVLAVWFIGSLAHVSLLQHFAAVAILPLTIWAVLGSATAGVIAFPLGYLLFMVPFGEFLIPPLMTFTADATVALVRLSGVAVYHDGLFFTIANGSFRIIEACSGIRMLIAAVALGTLFGYLSFRSLTRRLLFLAGTIVLALLANVIRAYFVVMTAHFRGMEAVADHAIVGHIVFAFVILTMVLVGRRFSDGGADVPAVRDSVAIDRRNALAKPLAVATCLVAAVIAMPQASKSIESGVAGQLTRSPVELPPIVEGWAISEPETMNWSPIYFGDTETQLFRYRRLDAQIDVYAIAYRRQQEGLELINARNTLYDREVWANVGGATGAITTAKRDALPYIETHLRDDAGRERLVRHWFVVADQARVSRTRIKLIKLGNSISGRPTPAAVVAASLEFDGDLAQAATVLDEFMLATF